MLSLFGYDPKGDHQRITRQLSGRRVNLALPAESLLVTKATEPSWTPIFINAAAVVLEVGGPLQHGAIIAREYGIPCFMNVRLSGIKDEQQVEMETTARAKTGDDYATGAHVSANVWRHNK